MSVNIKVTGGLNIEWGQIDPKVTGGLKERKIDRVDGLNNFTQKSCCRSSCLKKFFLHPGIHNVRLQNLVSYILYLYTVCTCHPSHIEGTFCSCFSYFQ